MSQKLPVCKHCGKPFLPNHKKQVFCSDTCRAAWHYQQEQKPKEQAEKIAVK